MQTEQTTEHVDVADKKFVGVQGGSASDVAVQKVEGLKALLAQLESTFQVLQAGTFPGTLATDVSKSLTWLQNYHKGVLAELHKEPSQGGN